jgi:hypothetical protein
LEEARRPLLILSKTEFGRKSTIGAVDVYQKREER